MLQHRSNSVINTRPPKPAARSRLVIGDFGPSDSALAAARGWRLRRPAADRHAARCASRDLCSGARPSAPCALEGGPVLIKQFTKTARFPASAPILKGQWEQWIKGKMFTLAEQWREQYN